MLFVTTSNGVYCLNTEHLGVRRILGRKHTRGLFKPRSRGYFGITRHPPTKRVLVASRETGGSLPSKLGTKASLHLIHPRTLETKVLATVNEVHDVHQIAWYGDYVLLTDTGKNRLVVFNPDSNERLVANIGAGRQDINHVNAILIRDDILYVGLNNRGVQPAAVLHMPIGEFMDAARKKEIDLATLAHRMELDDAEHTHDLEPDSDGRLLACKSYDGIVFELGAKQDWLKLDGWTRGLAFSPAGLWVGNSEFADRKQRHDEQLDGSVSLYAWPEPVRKDHIVLHGAGQVNDLLYLDDG
ncbi:MAG: hypothetical protein L0I62_04685 [Gammaproteobacteria bacterium]|nr:hypothetical protein [Gammaproteobacteria bacterium]